MDWKKPIEERLSGLNLDPAREAEVVEELSQHLGDQYRYLLALGNDPMLAYSAVLSELGDSLIPELRKTERTAKAEPVTLGANRGSIIKDLLPDLRYAFRVLRKTPAFAAVAILSLALGIGANTAIFQLFEAISLRTLPVESPQRLAEIKIQRPLPGKGRDGIFPDSHPELTFALWDQIQARQQAFSGVFAWATHGFNLSAGGEARNAAGLWVSGDFFNVLGVKPLIGRVFESGDDRRGCDSLMAVISYSFWQREFAGDPGVVGKPLSLNGHSVEIIGVTPVAFTGLEVGQNFDVAVPICSEAVLNTERHWTDRRNVWWLDVMGRLKPGWSIEQATAQLSAISSGVFRDTMEPHYTPEAARDYLQFKLAASPAGAGVSSLRESYEVPLYLLMGLAALVVLIACANLANLLLARASGREKEIAVRLALGASRGRLIRQLLSESLLIATLGGAAGAILGAELSRALVSFLSTPDNPVFVDLKPDFRVLAFTGGLSLLTGLLFGLAPALRASRNSPASAMRATSRGTAAAREHLLVRRGLVVAQVALSLILLVGALLFSGNLRRLLTADAGLRQDGIVIARLDFTNLNVANDRRLQFKQDLLDRVRAVPGVQSAAEVSNIPIIYGSRDYNVELAGDPNKGRIDADFFEVSPAYFETMGIPVLAGRDFVPADVPGSPPVAIVDQMFAKKLFGDANPLGARIRIVVGAGESEKVYQIAGLAGDTKYKDIHEDPQPIVYLAASQNQSPEPVFRLLIHAEGPPRGVISGVKETVAEVNPSVGLIFVVLRTWVLESLLRERLLATLSGFFGVLAVLLASIGLYGVISYGVTNRTSEIGVRMALGAERHNVIWMILREALVLVGIGVLFGLPIVIAGNRILESLLYNAKSVDFALIGLGVFALIAVATVAAYLPARRASRTDPMNALRCE